MSPSPNGGNGDGESILVEFVEFDFVNDWGVGGDKVVGAFGSEGELRGDIEAVDAAGIHELEGCNKAREPGCANDMNNGFTVAIGLVDGLTAEEVEALIVEADTLCILCLGTFARFQDLIIERGLPHPMTFDIGVIILKIGEVSMLEAVDIRGNGSCLVLHQRTIVCICILGNTLCRHIVEEVVLSTSEGVDEGFY